MKRLMLLFAALLLSPVHAEEATFTTSDLTLNANMQKADNWPAGPTLLITHGTLSHNKNELITALQELFLENGHWMGWLKKQGAQQIVLLGHSRGGNQTAWFATEHDDPIIKKVILVAPQTWSPEYAAKSYEKSYGKPLAAILKKAQSLIADGKPSTPMEHTDFIYCKDTTATADAFAKLQAGDVTYRLGSAQMLPFPDRAFDHAVAITSLCFLEQPQDALTEMWRVTQRTLTLGLLNRHSLLHRLKQGRGSYQGARWDTTNEVVNNWIPLLTPTPDNISVRTAIFFPQGNRPAQWAEAWIPNRIPWGGFLVINLEK